MKVLLVDDHTLFREGLALILSSVDPSLEVLHATHLAQAFAHLEAAATAPPELVLLDLGLRQHDGLDTLRRLRERAEAVPVVVISGDEDPATIRGCIDDGAMGFIPKASDATTLIGALRQVLAGFVYLPPLADSDASMPPPARSFGPQDFTPRQWDVLQRLVQGKTNKAIGQELGINDATVKSHVSVVLQVLGVSNRTEAVYALRHLRLK